MNNNHRKINFYTRGQRLAARVLLIVWLLASFGLQSTLADGITLSRGVAFGALLSALGSSLVLRSHSEMELENQDLRTLQEISRSPVPAPPGDSGPDVAPLSDCYPRSCDDQEALKCYLSEDNIELKQDEDGVPVGSAAEYYTTIVNIMSEIANATEPCLVKDLTHKELESYQTILEPLINAMYKVMKACGQNTIVIITSNKFSSEPYNYVQFCLSSELNSKTVPTMSLYSTYDTSDIGWTCNNVKDTIEEDYRVYKYLKDAGF